MNKILIFLMLCLFLGACTNATPVATPTMTAPPTATEPPPTPAPTLTPTHEKLAYGGRGKYIVGQQDYPIQVGDQILRVLAFYPALNGEPAVADGPFPLVIFSVGATATGAAYTDLLKPIASHGFVVLTWNPRGETEQGIWEGVATRPLDLQRIIQFADELNAADGKLAGMIDTSKIGVAGHSSGGWTALVGGGAQIDLGFCKGNPDLVAKYECSDCPDLIAHELEIAKILGAESGSEVLWPATVDPRVAAVIALAPDGDLWGADYQGLASVKVPTLIMTGSKDECNIPEICAYPIYAHLGSADKTLMVFEGADHGLGWEKNAEMVEHAMTAFLLAKLNGDQQAAESLRPENVTFPGVKVTTSGE